MSDFAKQIAIDTETYYSPKYSIRGNSTRWYVDQPDFDCYMVTLDSDEIEYAGAPEGFDWDMIVGMEAVAHNASFDERVIGKCVEKGQIPHANFSKWHCSADMCVQQQKPRALDMAVKSVFGHELSKDMRNWMKGKTWDDAVAHDKAKELTQYALDDSKWAWKLWKELSPHWPETERLLSRLTRKMAWEGLPVDENLIEEHLSLIHI